jgi:hypothetical protein
MPKIKHKKRNDKKILEFLEKIKEKKGKRQIIDYKSLLKRGR